MTLLCEITDYYAKLPYLEGLSTSKREHIPAIFGHELYRFLHKYFTIQQNPEDVFTIEPEQIQKIDSIQIVGYQSEDIKELFIEKLKSYSPMIENCAHVHEYGHWVPSHDLVMNEELKDRIVSLIQNSSSENIIPKSEDYICYLPLCNNTIYDHLSHSEKNHKVWTNLKIAQQIRDELIELNLDKVKEIYPILKVVKQKHIEIHCNDPVNAHQFTPPKYLENFRETYLEELKQTKLDKRKKEFHFFGYDDHSAREGVKHFLGSQPKLECDIDYLHGFLENKKDALVIWNLHHEISKDRQRDVEKYIRDQSPIGYIVIQGNNLSLVSYFDGYKKIHVPSENEIKNIISGIFVSLIYHEMIYCDDKADLYPIVKHKLFNHLLADNTNPQALSLAICELEKITKRDLLENVSFWYLLKLRYQEFYEQIMSKRPRMPKKEIWTFEFKDDEYFVRSPDGDFGPYKVQPFIIYIMAIVLYAERDPRGLEYTKIRKFRYIHDGLSPDVTTDYDGVRTSMVDVFDTAKENYNWFRNFYASFMDYSKKKFIIDFYKIDVKYKNFKLSSDVFDLIKEN